VIILTALGFFIYAIFIILRQKRLSEIQKDFINNMTHEFKTPISSIAISAAVLQEDEILENADRLKTYAGIIAAQNMKLEEHIERVLLSAKSEKKGMELKPEDLDLCSLIREVIQSYNSSRAGETNISIDCPDVAISVRADRPHLANLIHNLLDNAVKYSGEHAEVIVGCKSIHSGVKLFVEDNGPGIETKYHKKIFNRFFRVPGKMINSIKGFGLGLNYVKYVARAHGWKIELLSKPGKGSTFSVIIGR